MTTTVLDKALQLIGRRAHFREELRRKLEDSGYGADEVAKALDRLAELGYLDDGALARDEAERLRSRRGLGRAAIAAELGRKGAGREAVEAALEASTEPDESVARAAAERWLRSHAPDGRALARHLDRKGFGARVIFRVLKELIPDGETPPEVD